MHAMISRTTKSAGRRLSLTLLGVLVALVVGSLAVYAAGKDDFSVTATPPSQTVTQGNSTTYGVTVGKINNFQSGVALSVSGLPAGGTTAAFTPASVSPGGTSTLRVTVGAGTAPGTYTLTITGSGAGVTRSTTVKLVVQAAQTAGFALSASPLTATLSQKDFGEYGITMSRSAGFSAPVTLSVTGLPEKAVATLSPAQLSGTTTGSVLRVETASSTPIGEYVLSVTGSGGGITRTSTVRMSVLTKADFVISGNAASPRLRPGASAPLPLNISNPNNFPITVDSLRVEVLDATGKPGCSGTKNFAVQQYTGGRFELPAGESQLTDLVGAGALPQVRMLNLTTNQDACKGATVNLHYTGSAKK
jgi:hypothetical protein